MVWKIHYLKIVLFYCLNNLFCSRMLRQTMWNSLLLFLGNLNLETFISAQFEKTCFSIVICLQACSIYAKQFSLLLSSFHSCEWDFKNSLACSPRLMIESWCNYTMNYLEYTCRKRKKAVQRFLIDSRLKRPVVSMWNSAIYGAIKHVSHMSVWLCIDKRNHF